MIDIELSSKLDPGAQRFVRDLVSFVLARCDPAELISESIDFKDFHSPTHILAFGKASVAMTHACINALGPHFAGGVVLSPQTLIPTSQPSPGLHYFPVDHPTPTPRNAAATKTLADYARSIPPTDDCIVCISGGGSAHLCSPRPGITLDQIIDATNTLNAQGASIHELNRTRRSLETLKAGGLAATLAHVHHCRAIVLSDVLGDDLKIIASGPMLSTEYPVEHTIIGDHRTALGAAGDFLRNSGMTIQSSTALVSGDSAEQGQRLADRFIGSPQGAHLFAGETTVNATGSTGIGGPTLELTLATVLHLAQAGQSDWIALGLATDGIDGPTDAAGAIITSEMLPRPLHQAARQALADHDTLGFLDSIHATIRTGPTGTNLNDLCVVVPALPKH